jgi:tRNA dimethylallyltransferase
VNGGRPRVVALVGPTAVGKTALSVDLAEALGAEIVSLDSMQLYRGMDIGTDKAAPEMRERVPHHLIDLFEPEHDVTVAEFQALGRAAIEDISSRGRVPLLVGGSGLYFRALVDDLEFPPRSDEVRRRLEDELDISGPEALYNRLASLDPLAAGRIEPRNARRIIRALEVIELTGKPFSDNDAWDRYESRYDLQVLGLERERDELYARIGSRVDRMLATGLVEEALDLRDRLGRTARQALGYKQILDAPEGPPDSWRAEIVRATKRLARRQGSWFRADPRVRWLDAKADVRSVVGALEEDRGQL